MNNIREVETRLNNYFRILSNLNSISNENLIDSYFEDFKKRNDVDFEQIYRDNPFLEFPEKTNTKKHFINDENRLIIFSHLYKFIQENKPLFLSVNLSKLTNVILDYEKYIFICLDHEEEIQKIFSLTSHLTEKSIHKTFFKSKTIKETPTGIWGVT